MTDGSRRPRILIVTRNLPPLVGGMERLNWHMADELAKVADVRMVGPAGAARGAPPAVKVDEVRLKPLSRFLVEGLWRTWRVARAWRPDVVLAGSGLTALAAWLVARAFGSRAVVYTHGLDLAVRHPIYRLLWRPALRRMDRVIANSGPTARLAMDLGVVPSRIGILHPGVDLPDGPNNLERERAEADREVALQGSGEPLEQLDFREQRRLGKRPLLLSVGRLTTRKGLREFVVQAMPLIVADRPDALLVIVGDAPGDALHAQAQTQESILSAAGEVGVSANLLFIGVVTDYRVLGAIYRAADVHVFPVRDIPGDPEGFGMVAVEAAAHGLPTVAFATGGVVDAVLEGESGCLVRGGDYSEFARKVLRMLDQPGAMRGRSKEFARKFAWCEFGRKLSMLVEAEISEVDRPG